MLGLVGAYGVSRLGGPPESVWEGMLSEQMELVLVMRPANCGINGSSIQRVNDMAELLPIPVRGVFTSPPDERDREMVSALFDFTIPIEWDDDGAWNRAVATSGAPGQVAILARRGRIVRLVPVADWEDLVGPMLQDLETE